MKIQILGTGCPKCKKLAENAEAAAKALSLIVDSYPKEAAVAEHADFSAAPTAGSTP